MVKIRFVRVISPFSPVQSPCSLVKSQFPLVKILILPGFWLFYSPKKGVISPSHFRCRALELPARCMVQASRQGFGDTFGNDGLTWGFLPIQIPWGFIWVYIIRFTNRGLNSVKLLNKKNGGLVRCQWDFEWDFNIL